ncbi:MAG: phospholipid carrier-dependent glycosyltransferase [Chloroflexi bacterium]|nr:phospholipid carrier-dependent glycosyltransferase [Chloroflexota bacterium]NOG63938.1 phospholipid carrier-dependent glycosyltransferase [Chloroflexota bacterium]
MTHSSISKRRLWLMVGLLWLLWFSRAHQIMALAVFVDESLHILRAQMVFDFNDATASILPGKLLLYYYLGLFNPQDVGGAWLSREAIALLTPLGAALTYTLARQLFHRWSIGLLAVILYALSPFMLFFERMALSDTFTMIFGLSLAIVSLKLTRQPTRKNSIITGLLFGLALLAKLIALPWIILPFLALRLWGQANLRQLWNKAVIIGIAATVPLLPSAFYVVYQEAAQIENKQEVVTTTLFVPESQSRLEQISHNLGIYTEAVWTMLTPPLLFLILCLTFWQIRRRPKAIFYLLSITFSVWGFIVLTSAQPSTRYLVLGIPPLLIIGAVGLDDLWRTYRSSPQKIYRIATLAAVLSVTVGGGLGIRFLLSGWNDPTKLTLADRDIWEYFENTATGYGLRETSDDLPNLPPLQSEDSTIHVAGFVGACHTLRLYLPADSNVELTCPYFKWSIEQAPITLAEWEQRIKTDGAWYILADDRQPMDLFSLPFTWEVLAVYKRPYDGVTVRLYRVSP